jgi:hypothetical protein
MTRRFVLCVCKVKSANFADLELPVSALYLLSFTPTPFWEGEKCLPLV